MLAVALLRIGVDGLAISPAGKGHARTQLHAVRALAERGEHELVVFVRDPAARELLAPLGIDIVPVRARPTILWELVGLPRSARRHRLDGVLTLSERLPPAGGPPTVVWLFESPLHRIRANRNAGAGVYQRGADLLTLTLWKRSLRRARHVAFGSRATEQEVLSQVPALRGRTSVVHPGLTPGFAPGQASDRGQYVLHLGSADPRDNTAAAVEAARRAGVRLLVAGDAVPDRGGEGTVFLGRVSDEELVDLYRGAAAFLDPTLYEGFGYGVLEAMACGAPVVASDRTAIPEVVGDAGLLCDPRDVKALANALRRVLEEPGLAEELRRRGLARAAQFTWTAATDGLERALESIR